MLHNEEHRSLYRSTNMVAFGYIVLSLNRLHRSELYFYDKFINNIFVKIAYMHIMQLCCISKENGKSRAKYAMTSNIIKLRIHRKVVGCLRDYNITFEFKSKCVVFSHRFHHYILLAILVSFNWLHNHTMFTPFSIVHSPSCIRIFGLGSQFQILLSLSYSIETSMP